MSCHLRLWGSRFPRCVIQMSNGLEEDFFERVATMCEVMHVEPAACDDAPQSVQFDFDWQDYAPASIAFADTFRSMFGKRGGEVTIIARDFKFDEATIGAALLFKIGVMHDAPVFENDHFIADFFDVAEQMGAENHVHAVVLLHCANQFQHADAGRWVEAV